MQTVGKIRPLVQEADEIEMSLDVVSFVSLINHMHISKKVRYRTQLARDDLRDLFSVCIKKRNSISEQFYYCRPSYGSYKELAVARVCTISNHQLSQTSDNSFHETFDIKMAHASFRTCKSLFVNANVYRENARTNQKIYAQCRVYHVHWYI